MCVLLLKYLRGYWKSTESVEARAWCERQVNSGYSVEGKVFSKRVYFYFSFKFLSVVCYCIE